MVQNPESVSHFMEYRDFVAFFESFTGGSNPGPNVDLQGQDDLRTFRVDNVVGGPSALARKGLEPERGAMQTWRHHVSDKYVGGLRLRHQLGPELTVNERGLPESNRPRQHWSQWIGIGDPNLQRQHLARPMECHAERTVLNGDLAAILVGIHPGRGKQVRAAEDGYRRQQGGKGTSHQNPRSTATSSPPRCTPCELEYPSSVRR